jgi:hypothetical protein
MAITVARVASRVSSAITYIGTVRDWLNMTGLPFLCLTNCYSFFELFWQLLLLHMTSLRVPHSHMRKIDFAMSKVYLTDLQCNCSPNIYIYISQMFFFTEIGASLAFGKGLHFDFLMLASQRSFESARSRMSLISWHKAVNSNLHGCKKGVNMRLGSHKWLTCDQQEARRTLFKLRKHFPGALLWVTKESCKPPSWPEYTKTSPQQVDALTIWLKNHLKQHFFDNTTFNKMKLYILCGTIVE